MAQSQSRARAVSPQRRAVTPRSIIPRTKAATRRSVDACGGARGAGRADMKELLGGRGANLGEGARLGPPVPPGFTISPEVCPYYYAHRQVYPPALKKQVSEALARVEK